MREEIASTEPPSNAAANPALVDWRSLAGRFWYVPILAGYAGLVFYTTLHHEPWSDEAQAWLIARDASLHTMFSEVLRYEGHPPLWYLVLKVAIGCGLRYECLGLLSGAIATAGMAVLLVKSPFPKPIKLILSFNYFLVYQYAVIARSYVLLPLLLFTAATLARGKWERPIRWGICLALLANVCLHSFLIASGIMFVHVWQLVFRWRRLDRKARSGQIAAVCLYAAVALLVVIVLWPPPDNSAKLGFNSGFDFWDLAWSTVAAIDGALFEWPVVSAAFLALSCYWFWRTSVLGLFLAVWLPVLAVFLALRVVFHHQGILFLAWLFVAWCSMDTFAQMRASGRVDGLFRAARWAMLLFMAALAIPHALWTVCSVSREAALPYCGAEALAKYIETQGLARYRIAATNEWVTAVLPYFDENIIANFPSQKGRSYLDYRESFHSQNIGFRPDGCLAEPCDIIIWPEFLSERWNNVDIGLVTPPNWRLAAYFPGRLIFKDRFTWHHGFAVFVTKRVADELGLPRVDWEKTIVDVPTEQPPSNAADGYWKATGRYWDLEDGSARVLFAFANLVRKIDPESASWEYRGWEARNSLANSFAECRGYEESIARWRAPLGSAPQVANAHNNYGLALAGARRIEEAAKEFERAVETSPRCADARWNLGTALLRQGKGPQAVAQWREAMRWAPNNVDMLARVAWFLATSHDASLRNKAEAQDLAGRAARLCGGRDPAVLVVSSLCREDWRTYWTDRNDLPQPREPSKRFSH